MTNNMPSKEAIQGSIELGLRRRAQRAIELGEWVEQNETTLRVLQGIFSENFFAHIEGDKPSDTCWEDCLEAVELFIDLIVSLRHATTHSYLSHKTCLKSLTLTNRYGCDEHRTSAVMLPELVLPGAVDTAEEG